MFFFIGIFGIQDKQKTIREFNNVVCSYCGSLSRAELIEQYTYFHFFFLPLFRWNKRYYVRFRCCNRVFKVPKDYIDDLKYSSDINIDRLEEINTSYGHVCPNCGAHVDPSFVYCPYCGHDLE